MRKQRLGSNDGQLRDLTKPIVVGYSFTLTTRELIKLALKSEGGVHDWLTRIGRRDFGEQIKRYSNRDGGA